MTNKKRSIRETPRTPEHLLLSRIKSMPNKKYQAYAAFVYLFGNRVSEALGLRKTIETGDNYEYERTNNKGVTRTISMPKKRMSKVYSEREYIVKPLLAANIELWNGHKEVYTIEEAETMIVRSIPTFKTKHRPRRDAWVLVQEEKELCTIVWTYARETLSNGDSTPLWTFTRQGAYNQFKKYLGGNVFPHKLRDLRATKDAVYYGLDAKDLQEKYNWSRPDMAMYYGRKNQTDVIRKMKRSVEDHKRHSGANDQF